MARKSVNYPVMLKRIRSQLGLSQEGLARELGISFATVNRWENGQTRPSKLAKARLDEWCTRMCEGKKSRTFREII